MNCLQKFSLSRFVLKLLLFINDNKMIYNILIKALVVIIKNLLSFSGQYFNPAF